LPRRAVWRRHSRAGRADHAVFGGEIDLHGLDAGAGGLRVALGRGQLIVLGGDDQIEAVFGELLGELEADPLDAPVTRARGCSAVGDMRMPFTRGLDAAFTLSRRG
jgi:hypothetical protein